MFLLSLKASRTSPPKSQRILSEQDTFNFVRKVFVRSVGDETSADLKTISLMQDIPVKGAQAIEGPTGSVVVIQAHTE